MNELFEDQIILVKINKEYQNKKACQFKIAGL